MPTPLAVGGAAAHNPPLRRRGGPSLANDLADALRKVRAEPFTIRVKDIGRFEQRNGGAIWAGVEPREELAALAAKVERVCQQVGLEPEHRASTRT